MSTYDEAAAALLQAVEPVATYCERAHATGDPTDPAQAGRFRHVAKVESLLDAVADFGDAADALADAPPWERAALLLLEHLPPAPPTPLAQRITKHLSQPHMQARLALPREQRQAYAAITSHHLQAPFHVPF